jgi:CheY-like chemotaxis protein
MSKEKQESIFTAFKQEEDLTLNHYGGTGLGLSICAKYVKELQGTLEIESDLGKGARFYFSIPIEVINPASCYPKYTYLNKHINILDNGTHLEDIQNICDYLIGFGLPAERVSISHDFTPSCSHLICFQNKLSYEIYNEVKKQNITLLIIEDEMFSLSKNEIYQHEKIVSLNSYYGEMLHTTTYSKKKKRILIVDENKVNILLLTSILELEYVSIETAIDSHIALEKLYRAHRDNNTFDIIFIDQHMPQLLGSEVIERYRAYEKAQDIPSIYTISITGESRLSIEEHTLFAFHLPKPFNKQMVKNAILFNQD